MKIAVVFPYFAHYRKPIIDLLSNCEINDYIFIGGKIVSPQFSGMKLLDLTQNSKFILAENNWFLKYFSRQSNLINIVKEGNFDCIVVFADWKYLSTWKIIMYAKIKKIPIIFWSHGFRENGFSINNLIKNCYFNLFDGGLVFDNRARNIFLQKNYNNVEVIYNSLDFCSQSKILDKVKQNIDQYKLDQYTPYIVFSGRITQSKNLHLIVQALLLLKEKSIIVNAVIIGDGLFKEQLIQLSNQLGIRDQIYFYGSCYDESIIASYFYNAIACVIPSAVGLSAIHSLTYGCPVITDDYNVKHGPEVESVIEGITGSFYKFGDAFDLSIKIEDFLNLNDSIRRQFSINAQQIIKEKYNPNYQKTIMQNMISNLTSVN